MKLALIRAVLAMAGLPLASLHGEAVPVELVYTEGVYTLLRDAKPYYIKGAGGDHSLELLAAIGGNSIRTWGPPSEAFLDKAHELGLSVCVGLWIEHERHGFDYDDEAAVAAQIARHCAAIDRLKDHPAVLLWGIGNEVELQADNPKVWKVIEAVAAHAKAVDPHHPTMTVIAQAPADAIRHIREDCPSIDILGCNSYGGIGVLGEQIREAGWEGPYMVTEWGNDGNWEVDKTAWGAELEPTSMEKAWQRAVRYGLMATDRRHYLGSYAFHWGWKQETTPTWFNLFLEDGRHTESVGMLQYLWTGRFPDARAPRVANLRVQDVSPAGNLTVAPETELTASFQLVRGDVEDVEVHWELAPESTDKGFGGDPEEKPQSLDLNIRKGQATTLVFNAPEKPGPYRLYLYVYGEGKTAATANFPFLVE